MKKAAQRIVRFIKKKAGKLFRVLGSLLTLAVFFCAASSLLMLSDDPSIRSVIGGYEWLVILCLVICTPATLLVLFDEFMELVSNHEK